MKQFQETKETFHPDFPFWSTESVSYYLHLYSHTLFFYLSLFFFCLCFFNSFWLHVYCDVKRIFFVCFVHWTSPQNIQWPAQLQQKGDKILYKPFSPQRKSYCNATLMQEKKLFNYKHPHINTRKHIHSYCINIQMSSSGGNRNSNNAYLFILCSPVRVIEVVLWCMRWNTTSVVLV